MGKIRWWLFKRLSALGWWICPEPHKTNLQSVMPTWDDYWRTLHAVNHPAKPGEERGG